MKVALTSMLGSILLLSACGDGNPFTDAELETNIPTEETVAGDGTIFATGLNGDLTGDSFVYDDQGTPSTADDILRVNNIPFDNSDISDGGYTLSSTTIPNAFDLYESDASGSSSRQYYAIFQRSEFSEVAAIATGDYIQFGFGGAAAQRLGNSNGIPDERASFYTFTGDYAAVRVTTNQGGSDDLEYITGDAVLTVDILDFDEAGAVEGTITNRELFDVNGVSLGSLNDFISLATADIDFATGDIGSSIASSNEGVIDPVTGAPTLNEVTSGDWQGFFAGPDGEEIAGFVVLEGQTTAAEAEDDARETGVFIVTNTE